MWSQVACRDCALEKKKCETLIKLSQCMEIDDWPEGMNLAYEYAEIEETAEEHVISAVLCEDVKAF